MIRVAINLGHQMLQQHGTGWLQIDFYHWTGGGCYLKECMLFSSYHWIKNLIQKDMAWAGVPLIFTLRPQWRSSQAHSSSKSAWKGTSTACCLYQLSSSYVYSTGVSSRGLTVVATSQFCKMLPGWVTTGIVKNADGLTDLDTVISSIFHLLTFFFFSF